MSLKRTALKLASKADQIDHELKYTTTTTFSTNPGIINFSMSVIYTVCIFVVLTYGIIGAVLTYMKANSTWTENNILHLNTQHYLYYLLLILPVTISLIGYCIYSDKYKYDKLYIMSCVPLVLVCMNYAAHYLELVFVLHKDSFDMSFLPYQYVEWGFTTSMMLLVLAHIPSSKPQVQEVNPIVNAVEDGTPKNKQTPVSSKYRKERKSKKDNEDETDDDKKVKLQVPLYSILQINLITFVLGALSQMLREEFKIWTLLGACLTGGASLFFVHRFVCDRFVQSGITDVISKWFVAVWCYYPAVFFFTRYIYYKKDDTLEHDLWFVGELIGKVTLAAICSQMTTRQLNEKQRPKKVS